MAESELAATTSQAPRWIAASLEIKPGRDPLGLQTTTQDRLMPLLLPGILELSVRARYLSLHAFLLDEYRRLRQPTDGRSLSTFLKHREWEFGLAVLSCPHECGSVPVGADRLRPTMRNEGSPYPRGESVESAFGGYGLYYRSPLADLGIVARSGTLLGDRPIPVDVLTNSERAIRMAGAFRSAIEDTDYFKRSWMFSSEPLPVEVLREYADVCCLCQLHERAEERDAVHAALFTADVQGNEPAPPLSEGVDVADELGAETLSASQDAIVEQRRRSVAHYLTLLDAEPHVVDDESAYRQALWAPGEPKSEGHALVAGHWSALVAKDVWQDALCSIWSEFCRAGASRMRASGSGLTWGETRDVARGLVGGPPALSPALPTRRLAEDVAADRLRVDGLEHPVQADMDALRRWTDATDTATSGLITVLELDRRAGQRAGDGWNLAIRIASAWQPSLASVFDGLRTHLETDPTVADTLWWIVQNFILSTHERIAYSKLPEFTFRFRWEEGLLRFFDHGLDRFPLAAIRMRALGSLTHDLGLWEQRSDGAAVLTGRGRDFVAEVLE